MKHCRNCGREVRDADKFCPNCGQKVWSLTPEQAQEAVDILGKLKSQITAPVDTSLQGLVTTTPYIDAVVDNLRVYGDLLSKVQDHHAKAQRKPRLFNKKKWQTDARTLMIGLAAVSIAMPSKAAGDPEQSLSTPQGCFGIGFELDKIQQFTEAFIADYDAFISGGNPYILEKAGRSQSEIAKHLQQALSEVEKVVSQIADLKA
jgi:RNA polymerase subunit RPABC4/transcription elongation factor Spt4